MSTVFNHCAAADTDVQHLKGGDGTAPCRARLRGVCRTATQTPVGGVAGEGAGLDTEEQASAGARHRHCAAAGCAAVDEAALRHHYAASVGRHGTAIGSGVGAALKSDACNGDGRVDDAESCAGGCLAAVAVEEGSGGHTADDERRNVADADGGLVEGASTQGHESSAYVVDSVGDGFTRLRHAAAARGRVVAGGGVDND